MGHLERQIPSWMWMESDVLAEEVLQTVEKGRSCVYIPGLANRLAAKFFALPATRQTWTWMTSTRTKRVTWKDWFSTVFLKQGPRQQHGSKVNLTACQSRL